MLATAIALLLPALLGAALVRWLGIGPRQDRLAFLGWSLVTGAFATALFLALWLRLGLPPSPLVAIPVLVGTLLLYLRVRRTGGGPAGNDAPAGYLLVVGCVLFAALQSVAHGNQRLVTVGDEADIWAYHAKMIQGAGGFGDDYRALAAEAGDPVTFFEPIDAWFEAAWQHYPEEVRRLFPPPTRGSTRPHFDYPLFNPLLQVWTFANAGAVLHWQNRLPIQVLGLALLLILAGALLEACGPLLGACWLLVFAALLDTGTALGSANADGMVAAGLLMAADGIRRFQQRRDPRWLRIAAVGLAVMVWSKNEGLLYFVALLGGLLVARPDLPARSLRWLLLPIAVVAFSWLHNLTYGFDNDLVGSSPGGGIERLGPLLDFYWREVFTGPLWSTTRAGLHGSYLLLLVVCLSLGWPQFAFRREQRWMTVALCVALVGQMVVYFRTPHGLEWHLTTSAARVAWQLLPLATLWLGLATAGLRAAARP